MVRRLVYYGAIWQCVREQEAVMWRRKPKPESGIGSRLNWDADFVPEQRLHNLSDEEGQQPPWVRRSLFLSAFLLILMSSGAVYLKYRPITYTPMRWFEASGFDRGRMLKSLFAQADFVGFVRGDAQIYLGKPGLDERQIWYDIGSADRNLIREARADVGDSTRLMAVFTYGKTGQIRDVLYSYRRPTLGSEPFDSAGWFGDDVDNRTTMFPYVLRRLRNLGMSKSVVERLLGPPTGHRIRAHYYVGNGGQIIGTSKALVLSYDRNGVVESVDVVD
jgi:hypothetical protein